MSIRLPIRTVLLTITNNAKVRKHRAYLLPRDQQTATPAESSMLTLWVNAIDLTGRPVADMLISRLGASDAPSLCSTGLRLVPNMLISSISYRRCADFEDPAAGAGTRTIRTLLGNDWHSRKELSFYRSSTHFQQSFEQ